ncbi:hypothetical protein G4B88_011389, partial [Cannabis sativa]
DPPSLIAFLPISARLFTLLLISSASSPSIILLTAFVIASLFTKSPTCLFHFLAPTSTPILITIGTPTQMLSSVEFQPQCVTNPPTASCWRIETCGAHPLIINPVSFILSSNPSGSHSSLIPSFFSFFTTQMNCCPEASSPVAISMSCSSLKLAMLPKLT